MNARPWFMTAKDWLVPPAISRSVGTWLADRNLSRADRAVLVALGAYKSRNGL